jgi:hypothetical protein
MPATYVRNRCVSSAQERCVSHVQKRICKILTTVGTKKTKLLFFISIFHR